MSKDSNDKGQQDRSNGKYDPPSSPGIFSSQSQKEQYYKDKEDYDKSWEVTKAQQDQTDNKYRPPTTPSMFDSDYTKEKKWSERDAYDKSWDDSKDNSDSQAEEKSSGCFITSACVESRGLQDNCLELETLRNFRDTYILAMADGKNLIQEYYSDAPKIVDIINQNSKRQMIYNWLFDELVQKSLDSLKMGNKDAAFKNYKSIFQYLQYNLLDN